MKKIQYCCKSSAAAGKGYNTGIKHNHSSNEESLTITQATVYSLRLKKKLCYVLINVFAVI